MLGLMMDRPLLISQLIEHAAEYHGDNEIVSRSVEGPIHRYTYADAARRSRRLANALKALGVAPGDRIGTLAWNGTGISKSISRSPGAAPSATRLIRASFQSRSPISSTMPMTASSSSI